MSVTFPVSDVDPAWQPLAPVDPGRGLEALLEVAPEAFSRPERPLVAMPSLHPVAHAVHLAFQHHYPLVLSPDAVWITLAQGFAQHVLQHAEQLRGRFVKHTGKVNLKVRRDDFIPGAPENPWPEVFAEFSSQIAAHIGELQGLLVSDFSTTGPIERAASEVVLMHAMSEYFDYSFFTLCGIPSVTLLGTPDDWRAIRKRAKRFAEFDLAWWCEALAPVLDQFILASKGKADTAFWRSLYKYKDESGGPYITGWINVFFPYLNDKSRNSAATTWRERVNVPFGGGPQPRMLPPGHSVVRVDWTCLDQLRRINFIAGLMGVSQDPRSLAVRPEIGWAIAGQQPAPQDAPRGKPGPRRPRQEENDEDPPQPLGQSQAPYLLYRDENGVKQIAVLRPRGLIIGRGVLCGIRPADREVARKHCRVYQQAEDWILEDLGAGTKTWLNDEPVERAVLRNGDILRCGSLRVRFVAAR